MYNIEQALDQQILEYSGVRPTVIFTEPTDPRVLEALCQLVRFVRPVLLASEASVRAIAAKELRHLEDNSIEYALSECSFVMPSERVDLLEQFAEEFRQYKASCNEPISLGEARDFVSQQGPFGVMAVRLGHADAVVGGAVHRPRQFYRPMVKLLCRSGFCSEAGVFILPDSHPANYYPNNIVVFGDVGVNASVTPETLARVAVGTCMVARDIIPEDLMRTIRGVLVSYSHGGSDEGPSPELVREATALIPGILAERCQRDARFGSIQMRGEVKASVALSARSADYYREDGAQWEGAPSVIVCPNLEMGNMLYHLYATSYPEAQYFTVMFGLGNRGVSLARDCRPDNIRLAVKSTILRLLRFDQFEPVLQETFFKRPRVLAINPGSTSTKINFYRGEDEVFSRELSHSPEELAPFDGKPLVAQFDFRKDVINTALAEHGVTVDQIDAVAARGGMLCPMPHGTYIVGPEMLEDLRSAKWGEHASNLGGIIANSLVEGTGKPAYIVDPVVVDELAERVRITGIKEIRRRSVSHALNQVAIARRYAAEHETFYERINVIVAHMGGGVSVGAHKHGWYLDVNNALDGEGPFTPERSGSLPVGPLIEMCFSGKFTHAQMKALNKGKGGLYSLLGTSDLRKVEQMVVDGNEEAIKVLDALAYAIAKQVASLWPAFEGQDVDQILLTGGMARCRPLVDKIKDYLANTHVGVSVYPGENEMVALAKGALRVLFGKERAKAYPPA